MKFNYQARTKNGEIQSGVVDASSKEAAINVLKSYQLFVTAVEEIVTPFYVKEIRLFERVSRKEVVTFSRQLSIMFKSGIPLIEILQTLFKQTENPALKEKIAGMLEKIEGGNSLSKTFGFYSDIFSPFYISMVKSGEASGKLSDIFSYLADHLEREYNFNAKIKGALIYPAFLSAVFLLVGLAMAYFILPQLTPILTQGGQTLPLLTKILIGFGEFLRTQIILLVILIIAAAGALIYYFRTSSGRSFLDHNLLKVPLLGNFLKKTYLARFALNLSTLVSGGLPIVQAIEITGEVVGNEVYKNLILDIAENVKKGEAISGLLQRYPKEITPLFIQMIVVGEKTGKLDSALVNVVDYYQKDVDRSLENFMRLLEPILIIFFGILVALLMVAIVTPLYQTISNY